MTTVLIDGDILIYKAACAAEKEIRWPDGVWSYAADEQDGIAIIHQKLKEIMEGTKAEEYVICFSDDDSNFRKAILPTYKSNREGNRKPLILKAMRNYCLLRLNSAELPNLEADDVLGIMATSPELIGRSVIATIDKDLAQIPAPVYNIDTKKISKPEHRDGKRMMLKQVLIGDVIDGYHGCPGIGEASAEEILDNPFKWEQYEHTFKSGPRKGLTELRWRKGGECSVWESIVSHYEKAGLTEADAIQQAQCAYILQSKNYDEDGGITLWQPPQ